MSGFVHPIPKIMLSPHSQIVSGWTSPKPKMKRCSCKLARSLAFTEHKLAGKWAIHLLGFLMA